MGKLRTVLKILAGAIGLVLAVLVVAYVLVDTENHPLDATTRAAMSGSSITLSDGVTRYQVSGPADGRIVLLIHGGGLNSLDVWEPLAANWSQEPFRIVRYDLFGQGGSDRPETTYNLDLYDRQLTELLSKLNITGQVDIVGTSMGGMVGVNFADRHAERVRSLTLIAPAGLETRASFEVGLSTFPGIGEYLFKVFGRSIIKNRYQAVAQYSPRYSQHVLQHEFGYAEIYGTRRAILSVLRNMPLGGMEAVYRRVGGRELPVLIFLGKQDQTVPLEVKTRLTQAMPRAEVHEIDQAAHGLVYDNSEAIARTTAGFFKRLP